MLRSELPQDHPLTARVKRDLDVLHGQNKIQPPDVQYQKGWQDFLFHVRDCRILTWVAEVGGTESEPFVRFADDYWPQITPERLAGEIDAGSLRLVVLETLPWRGSNGFAAVNGLAWQLCKQLGCPVVAVSHPHTYVQWLKTDSVVRDDKVCTVTGFALGAGPGLEACLAHEARKGLQNKAPTVGIPVIYLPKDVDAGLAASNGGAA
jgi:hypothetical protein